MKGKLLAVLAAWMFLAGAGLLAYPMVSNLYYEWQQERLTEYYDSVVAQQVEEEALSQEFQECWDYNQGLLKGGVLLTDPFEESQLDPSAMPYAGLLNLNGDGSMGYLTIPAIDVNLVVYHGVEEEVLQKGVGHLQGSSLPVGGVGSHCVLSAHTGLNNKKLFTDLDRLVEGDVFYLHVLGEVLAYQVDQIQVVLPHETQALNIHAQQDYVTLVTCTPYGINSHRLLVRGVRIPYQEAVEAEQAQEQTRPRGSTWREEYAAAAAVGVALLGSVALAATAAGWVRRRRGRRGAKGERRKVAEG